MIFISFSFVGEVTSSKLCVWLIEPDLAIPVGVIPEQVLFDNTAVFPTGDCRDLKPHFLARGLLDGTIRQSQWFNPLTFGDADSCCPFAVAKPDNVIGDYEFERVGGELLIVA